MNDDLQKDPSNEPAGEGPNRPKPVKEVECWYSSMAIGRLTTYTYDREGRLLMRQYSDGSVDDLSEMPATKIAPAHLLRPGGVRTTYVYDARTQPNMIERPHGEATTPDLGG